MFLGHFGVAFAAKRVAPRPSLGTAVLAAQWADAIWPIFVLLGIEQVAIRPGVTVVTPLDFVFYPYSHSLLADVIWAALFAGIGWLVRKIFLGGLSPVSKLNDRMMAGYPGLVGKALRRPWTVVGASVVLFAVSAAAVPLIGTRLVPDLSQGEFAFQIRLPEGTPLEITADTVARIEQPFVGDTRFERIFSSVGSLPSSASGRRC